MPDTSPRKAQRNLQHPKLRSQLFDRVVDLIEDALCNALYSNDGIAAAIAALYKSYPLSIGTDLTFDFMMFINTSCDKKQSF